MFQDPSSGSQQGAQFLQNVCQQQPPYEQDPHMPAAGRLVVLASNNLNHSLLCYLQVSSTVPATTFATIRTVQWNEARQHLLTNTVHDVKTHKMPNI